jgi:hypothetical protein
MQRKTKQGEKNIIEKCDERKRKKHLVGSRKKAIDLEEMG